MALPILTYYFEVHIDRIHMIMPENCLTNIFTIINWASNYGIVR